MQLGARWRTGTSPHRGVPPELHATIAEQETAFPEAHSWTLTWLEGRPRCELDHLVRVSVTAAGEISVTPLAGDRSPGHAGAHPAADTAPSSIEPQLEGDDDDDDWLS